VSFSVVARLLIIPIGNARTSFKPGRRILQRAVRSNSGGTSDINPIRPVSDKAIAASCRQARVFVCTWT